MSDRSVRKKGSILVFVLALIVFISVLSIRLMKETTQELRHVSQFHKRDDLRTYAYSALDSAVAVMNEYKMALQKLGNGQAWQRPLEFANLKDPSFLSGSDEENRVSGIKWNIDLIDESGKIPLNHVSDKNLQALFAQMVNDNEGGGLFDEDDGRPFLECLRDWEDEDDDDREDGAEDDFYEDLVPGYFTPGRKVSSFDEFEMIKGFGFSMDEPEESGLFFLENGVETPHFRNFKDSFSFYNEGAINPHTCSDFILRVLAGSDDSLYEDLVEKRSSDESRDRKEFFDQMSKLAGEMGLQLSQDIIIVRAIVTVERGKSMFQLHAVLSNQLQGTGAVANRNAKKTKLDKRSERNEKLKYPMRILALRENENLID